MKRGIGTDRLFQFLFNIFNSSIQKQHHNKFYNNRDKKLNKELNIK